MNTIEIEHDGDNVNIKFVDILPPLDRTVIGSRQHTIYGISDKAIDTIKRFILNKNKNNFNATIYCDDQEYTVSNSYFQAIEPLRSNAAVLEIKYIE